MIHKPWSFAIGDSDEMIKIANRLDDIENRLVSIYSRKTGIDKFEIRDMLAAETWMDDEQALEMGFVDETMAVENRLVALTEVPWINKNIEFKASKKIVLEKVNKLKEEIEGFLAHKK